MRRLTMADADFVCTEEFTGVITEHPRGWLAVIPGCSCCSRFIQAFISSAYLIARGAGLTVQAAARE
jgi:hypothetical protein